jgi:ubiquinone/menaquinone biosynthesis C-methylase UbiE
MTKNNFNGEITRIQAEYLRRDASGLNKVFSYLNPAFLYHMQEREWAMLSFLKKEGLSVSDLEILEIGCGTGHILERFLQFGAAKAAGIDLMEHRIRMGSRQYPALLLSVGDAARLPYRDGSFNFVMQFMCISSVLDKNTRRLIAREMLRVVKPGGAILSYDMRKSPAPARFLSLLLHYFLRLLGRRRAADTGENPTPTEPLGVHEIEELFGDCNLKYRSASLNFELARIAARSRLAASFLSLVPWLRTHYFTIIRKPL